MTSSPCTLVTLQSNIETMSAVCTETRLPVEPSKTGGTGTTITFLGIELDSFGGAIRLPEDTKRLAAVVVHQDHVQKARITVLVRSPTLTTLAK